MPRSLVVTVLAMLIGTLAAAGPALAAIEPEPSANHLDRPVDDVAILEAAGPDGAPRLLTLDRVGMPEGVVRATVLERDRAWTVASESIIDLEAQRVGRLEAPWLIPLGPTSFALLATAPGSDVTVVIGLRTDGGPGRNEVLPVRRTEVSIAIDDAGAADVDGDRDPELVLAAARTVRVGGACQSSELWTIDPARLGLDGSPPTATSSTPRAIDLESVLVRPSIRVPERRIAGGVIGSFDDAPGEDLVVYAYPNCPAGPDRTDRATLITVRLTDGTIVTDEPAADPDWPPIVAAPLRLDVDRDGRHELVAQTPRGLTVLDPRIPSDGVPLATARAVPLAAVAAVGERTGAGATVAWLEPPEDRPGRIGTEAIRRDATDGDLRGAPATVMFPQGETTERWNLIQTDIVMSAMSGRPPTAWVGGIDDPACPDLLLPGAVLGCASGELAPGAAWIATRPLTLYGEGLGQRLLVASSVAWAPESGLPATPAPSAGGPPGWWRHGPSPSFVLAELRAGDATYYREFPTPRATLEHATTPGAETVIPGFTGVRFFVTAAALAETAADPSGRIETAQALGGPLPSTGQAGVVRVPVPPGVDSGRDGASTSVPLAGVTLLDGSVADRWAVTVVPLNDWGEMGDAVIGAVIRDRVGPSLAVDTPFMTPVWPLPAAIKGSAEPRSVVEVDGIGPVDLDRRGNFEIQTSLLPWPQTLRVTATDASGNATIQEVSLIGGLDYRRFPWPMIWAVLLLLVAAVSGIVGTRWRGVTARIGGMGSVGGPIRSAAADRDLVFGEDGGPVAEIEDLPPGEGLGRL